MNTHACGMTRFHPFLPASAPSRSCVRTSGHDGLCRDRNGGSFQGSRPRPRALTPEEVDDHNRAAFAEDDAADDVAPCPVPDCALLAGHPGRHVDLDNNEWAGTTEDVRTLADVDRKPYPAEVVTASLARIFAKTPSETPVKALRMADGAFGTLDALLRSGSPLPRLWEPRRASETDGHVEAVTELYDELSEALRFRGDPFDTDDALCAASAMWRDLDGELMDGGPLPTPWQ